jgi:hypothetical protein
MRHYRGRRNCTAMMRNALPRGLSATSVVCAYSQDPTLSQSPFSAVHNVTARTFELQMRAPGQERIQAAFGTPGEIAAQIGVGVVSGGALEPGKIGCHREPQPIIMRDEGAGLGGD